VETVSDTSSLAQIIVPGDRFISIDEESVFNLSAIDVSKGIISQKGHNPKQELVFMRQIPDEM